MRFLPPALMLASLVTWSTSMIRWEIDGVPELYQRDISEELYLASVTICAFSCRSRRCTSYTFQVGLCRIYNKGLDLDDSSVRRYRIRSSSVNVAVLRPSTASPNYPGEPKELANDGFKSTVYHSAYGEPYAWYNVDLGLVYPIKEIRLFPNFLSSTHFLRFHDIEVKGGLQPAMSEDAPAYVLLGYYNGPYMNDSCCSVDFSFDPPVMARYVHVRRATAENVDEDFLIMNEIEVYV